jgi:glycosyltransferase involved in cell wall biosynthesis
MSLRPRSSRPRLLLLQAARWGSGSTEVNFTLAQQWNVLGTPTEAVILQGGMGRGRPRNDVTTRVLARKTARVASPVVFARLLVACHRADVVLGGSEADRSLFLGWLASRLTRRPFVVIVHASPSYMIPRLTPRLLKRPTRWVLPRCDAAICVSGDLVDELVRLGLDQTRVFYVPNGVNVEDFAMRAAAARAVASPSPLPVVVAVGRLNEQKGIDLLVRAHAELVRRGLRHRLVVLGDGPERASLEQLVTELAVENTVELAGLVPDVVPQVATADVLCLSSRHEGFPLVLLEALAMGTPVIATDCSTGVSELLDDGRYGDLVPVGSVGALADALERFFADPTPLQRKVGAAAGHVARYSTTAAALAYLRILDGLFSPPAPDGGGQLRSVSDG